jgi:anti-anti-sigma factor
MRESEPNDKAAPVAPKQPGADTAITSGPLRLERHGEVAVITPSQGLETVPDDRREKVIDMILGPLHSRPPAALVFDLSQVAYLGSIFLSFLLRCHKRTKEQGGEVAIANAHPRTRELLQLTALDRLWPLYPTLAEALKAVAHH